MDKVCSKCRVHVRTGTSSWCNPCRAERESEKRRTLGIPSKRKRNPELLASGFKECFKCNNPLPVCDFSPTKRGYGGLMAWCKLCCSKYGREETRDQLTQYTKSYRQGSNRGKYLVQHRHQQQKRRASKQAGDDGSVTTAFMLSLYATAACYYCGKDTPQNQRTADHKWPLSKGGLHSITNLVMCCRRCNSSKKDRTEEEFLRCMKLKLYWTQCAKVND